MSFHHFFEDFFTFWALTIFFLLCSIHSSLLPTLSNDCLVYVNNAFTKWDVPWGRQRNSPISWDLYFSVKRRYMGQNVNMIADSANTVNKWKQANMPVWGEWHETHGQRWPSQYLLWEQMDGNKTARAAVIKYIFLTRVPVTKGLVKLFFFLFLNPFIVFKLLGEYKKGQVK